MKIKIEKNIDTENPVDEIINNLITSCYDAAESLLYDAGLDDAEVTKNIPKVRDEIFENVLTKLAFEYNKEG